jgi:hypothetical protein
MLRSEVTGHRPRVPPQWRMILARVREQHWRVREQDWKESEAGELLLNGTERVHALDDMLHWRDPVERLRTLRRRRRTLIDDNPCSG